MLSFNSARCYYTYILYVCRAGLYKQTKMLEIQLNVLKNDFHIEPVTISFCVHISKIIIITFTL